MTPGKSQGDEHRHIPARVDVELPAIQADQNGGPMTEPEPESMPVRQRGFRCPQCRQRAVIIQEKGLFVCQQCTFELPYPVPPIQRELP